MVSIFKTNKSKTAQIDTIEAFNIWNFLRSRYSSFEAEKLFLSFVHDRDFALFMQKQINTFSKEIEIMENEARKHKVITPDRPPIDLSTMEQVQVLTDRIIFRRIFDELVAELTILSRAMRTSITNDPLRNKFVRFFFRHLDGFEFLYKYAKVKAWMDIEPAYKTAGTETKEKLSVSEANHLWEHLSYRYDQKMLTGFFLEFVHDPDFKLILEQGTNMLMKQIKQLEGLMTKFQVPLPERSAAVQEAVIDPEIMNDKFIFRMIFSGVQSVMELHTAAVVDSTRNDYVRKVFHDLLKTETDTFDKLIKYGKAKGWSKIPPMYVNKA